MEGSGPARPKVFLSSVFKDTFGGDFKYVPLRKRIVGNKYKLPVDLWAYEHLWPENTEAQEPDADTIIDRCFAGIRACELFVFLLTGRHGSGASYFEDPAWASYLELELFAASALRKPILVLHLRGHEPDPVLRDSMILLNRAFAAGEYVIDDENGLYQRFQDICRSLSEGNWKSSQNAVLAHLPEWLSIRRTRDGLEDDLSNPNLKFLDGHFRSDKSVANPDQARRLLEQVASGVRKVAGNECLLPHGASLFRLWAAMRELMDSSGQTLRDPSSAALWDRALGLWAGKASWFGLHGHLWMGPLAAINSQIELRKELAADSDFRRDQDVREPLGARASAIYSIAQRMESRGRKLFHYRQAAMLATRAIDRDSEGQGGALSIRAHALMQMSQLGHVWKLWDAARDFRRSLELRDRTGASTASIGEAKADLGFCTVLTGRPRAGLSLLQDGVALMRNDGSADGKAFLVRGLRKLERAAGLIGARRIAAGARMERLSVSEQIEALDQAREP